MSKKKPARRKPMKKLKTAAQKESKRLEELRELFLRLKNLWPTPLSGDAARLFEQTEVKLGFHSKKKSETHFFDLLTQLKRVFAKQDMLFLRRQLTYQLAIPDSVPEIFGSSEEMAQILSDLVVGVCKFAPRKSALEVSLKNLQTRLGSVVELKLANVGSQAFSDAQRQHLFDQFYRTASLDSLSSEAKPHGMEETGGSIAYCRELLKKQGGQLWFEVSKEGRMEVTLILPAYDTSALPAPTSRISYKYEIHVRDFAKLRQRFGVDRSQRLVGQVEHFIRTLVRFPVDYVLSFPDKGQVVVVYESQEGSAQTVPARVSQRLKTESFRVGHKPTQLGFAYQLSRLV